MTAISLTQIRNKYKESHPEVQEDIAFTVGEGADTATFTIKHPLYRSNEDTRRIQRAAEKENGTNQDLVSALLGEKEYKRFVAAGGQDVDVIMLMQLIQENDLPQLTDQDAEGNPTRL